MFQKKVPGYRKGGGIMRLATGGVIGERTIGGVIGGSPAKGVEGIAKNKFLKNKAYIASKKGKPLPLQDFITKHAKSPLGKIARRGLGVVGGLGSLAYNLSPSFRGTLGFGGENNPIRNLDVDPSAASLFRGRGDNFIRSLDNLGRFDLKIEELEALGDRKTQLQLNDLNRLKKLKNQKQQGGMFGGGIDKQLTSLIGGDRKAYDNTIDIAIDQLTSGSAALMTGAQLGQINTAKGVAEILNKERNQLLELLQSGSNEEAQQLLSQIGGGGDQLKSLVKMLDIEAYEKLFPEEVKEEAVKEVVDPEQEAKDQALADLKAEDLKLAQDNQKAARILAENRAIAGNTLNPKVEEKALMAAVYGGGPNATAFDYVKNADLTRIAEEEKADKTALERAKVMGSGFSDNPRVFEIGTGINIAIYDPTASGVQQGRAPFITDTDYLQASSHFEAAIKNSKDISDRIDQLENMLADDDLTSAFSFLSSLGSRAANALNISADSSDQQKYNAIAKAVQAYFTKDFLQENGRTISNIDRELVDSIFPTIGKWQFGSSEGTLLDQIQKARVQIKQKQDMFGIRLDDLGRYNPKMAAKYTKENLTKAQEDRLKELTVKQG